MNAPLILATFLSFLTLLAHALTGENALLVPLAASDLSDGLIALITVLWHGLTAILILNTLMLAFAFRHPVAPLIALIGAQYLAYAMIFILVGQFQLGSIFIMPQWIAGLLIFLLSMAAILTKPKNSPPLN